MVLGAVAQGDEPRVVALVEALLREADRERVHPLGRLLCRERGERGGVDAAREQHADRHVGEEMRLDRVAEPRAQLLDELGLVAVAHLGQAPAARSARS